MEQFLHMRTTFFVVSMIGLILFVCMVYVDRTRKTYAGFRYWAAAAGFYFLANILIGLRGVLPDLITVVIANMVAVTAFLVIPYGLVLFVERRHPMWPYLLVVAGVALFTLYFTYVSPSISNRIIVISVIYAITTLYAIAIFKRMIPSFLKGSNLLVMIPLGAGTFWSIIRLTYTLVYEHEMVSFLAPSVIQGITIIIYCGLITFACFGLCVLNFQKVEYDLLKARDDVKSLEGILPICSLCKKIRDDTGYWNQVESYIREHSDATFSHSLCPECLKKVYPGHDHKP